MKYRDLELCGVFMAAMFLFLMVGTAVLTGTLYGMAAGLGMACMFVSMYFWCRFALPKVGNKQNW